MKKTVISALALAASFALPTAASASSMIDAGFEASPVGAGTPIGWFTNNPALVQVVTGFGGYTPTEGSKFALLTTGAAGVATVLTQIFNMTAGEAISFMVAFSTTEYGDPAFDDAGALGIFDFTNFAGTTLFSQSVSTAGAYANTPWTKVTFTAPVSGSYALNASVRNVGDNGFNSYLLLDAPAVPEPGTWMLMLLGVGAVGFSMRRRHNVRVNFA